MALPAEITRDEFLSEFWDYGRGQHVLVVSPTGGGKTRLVYGLMARAIEQNPGLSVCTLMPKPADPTTVQYMQEMNFKETESWPPRKPSLWDRFGGYEEPNGYVLWPKHPQNLPTNERREIVGAALRKGLDAQYWAGNSISFVDDAHSAATLMKLNDSIEEMVVNGRSGGAGIWLATQKPSGSIVSGGLTTFAYSNTHHMFFGKDYVESNLKRLGEIGGVDPKQVEGWVRGLRVWNMNGNPVTEFLYFDRRGPYYLRILPW